MRPLVPSLVPRPCRLTRQTFACLILELFSVTIGPLAKPVDISYNAKGEFAGQAVVYFQAANVRPFFPS